MELSRKILIDQVAIRHRVQEMAALRHRLEALEPARLRIAVLLDKPSRRSEQVRVEFTGFTVEDRWVVGYGLDWSGLYRNLPYISFVDNS